MLNHCFELVQSALLYQTKCDPIQGPSAPTCETARLFSGSKGGQHSSLTLSPEEIARLPSNSREAYKHIVFPPTAEAYVADPEKWESERLWWNATRNSYPKVYKIYGVLPAGQRLHINGIRRYAFNSYELGTFWAETAMLEDGPFAGHTLRIPSGSVGEAWITMDGPPMPVETILKECDK